MLSFSFRPPFNLNERYLQSRVYAANGKDCIMSIVNILQSRVYAANIFTAFAEKTGYLQSRVYAANGSDPDYSIRVALQSRVYAANSFELIDSQAASLQSRVYAANNFHLTIINNLFASKPRLRGKHIIRSIPSF